jgi:hypothetical protein
LPHLNTTLPQWPRLPPTRANALKFLHLSDRPGFEIPATLRKYLP